MITTPKMTWFLVPLCLFLLGIDGGGEGSDERARLIERQRQLSQKTASLKREHDFLLFQKEFYASDSKYLILNLASHEGYLKYRNRVLKGFRFTASSGAALKGMPTGAITLTKKVEGAHRRFILILGKNLIMQSKPKQAKAPPKAADPARIYLSKKDLASIFYALEVGSRAYIIR